MDTEQYKKNLDFFREVLKIEIDDEAQGVSRRISGIQNNNHLMSVMKKTFPDRYDDFLKISTLDDNIQLAILNIIQEALSTSFRYFFRRLEEGENNDDGQRMSFKLTMINEETKEETILIDGTEESQLDNNFQEWILENCSNLKTE